MSASTQSIGALEEKLKASGEQATQQAQAQAAKYDDQLKQKDEQLQDKVKGNDV